MAIKRRFFTRPSDPRLTQIFKYRPFDGSSCLIQANEVEQSDFVHQLIFRFQIFIFYRINKIQINSTLKLAKRASKRTLTLTCITQIDKFKPIYYHLIINPLNKQENFISWNFINNTKHNNSTTVHF